MALEPETLTSTCANPALEPASSSLLVSFGTKTSATYKSSNVLAKDPNGNEISRTVKIRYIFFLISVTFCIRIVYLFYIVKLRKIYSKYIILFLTIISVSSPVGAAKTESPVIEYGAHYELKVSNVPVRIKILREVVTTDGPKKIAIFKASSPFFEIDQKSIFILNGAEIIPSEYFYKKRVLGKTDTENFTFDQDNNSIEPLSAERKIGEKIFDKLSVQYQLQLDLIQEQEVKIGKSFSYQVKEKENLKSYKFVVDSIEKIDTEIGILRTLRIMRERKTENRSTILWLAPRYKYTLVKMIQREKGKVWELDIKKWSKNVGYFSKNKTG